MGLDICVRILTDNNQFKKSLHTALSSISSIIIETGIKSYSHHAVTPTIDLIVSRTFGSKGEDRI